MLWWQGQGGEQIILGTLKKNVPQGGTGVLSGDGGSYSERGDPKGMRSGPKNTWENIPVGWGRWGVGRSQKAHGLVQREWGAGRPPRR